MLIVNRPAAQREECPYTNSYVAGEGACGPRFFGWEHTEGGAHEPSGPRTGKSGSAH
jgi:hypothetical protein